MTRRFTGWHMAAIVVAFFGVVVAVNFTMAYFAISTFGGTVVDNSYVASQKYNRWLAEARAQQVLGWSAAVGLDTTRRVRIDVRSPSGPLLGATVVAVAAHPLGRSPERGLSFAEAGGGRFLASAPLPAGRHLLRITVHRDGRKARFNGSVPA
jgi:nitrogen fixation protein FixH